MKLTTLNLQGFTNWKQRQSKILDYLRDTKPDIILFQEVVFLPEISPYSQVQLLNQELEYPYEHSSITRLQVGVDYATFREGLSTLSTLPVVSSDTIILKKAPEDEHNRIIQLIDVRKNNQIIKIANVHFSLSDTTDYATAHLVETLEILNARKEVRIIAGDFNLENLEKTSALWHDAYIASSHIPYLSQPSLGKCIDYVLIPKAYRLETLEVSNDELSDHRAVTVTVL